MIPNIIFKFNESLNRIGESNATITTGKLCDINDIIVKDFLDIDIE